MQVLYRVGLYLACLGYALTLVDGACNKPSPAGNMYADSEDSVFSTGDTIYYKCQPGYVSGGGSGAITCQSGGTWSSATLTCNPKPCPSLSLLDGSLSNHVFQFGSRVDFTCNNCYRLSGSSYATCTATGDWHYPSGEPTCNTITCPHLDPPSNGHFEDAVENHCGSRATYVCESTYFYSGLENPRICQSDGLWSGTNGDCITGRCADPTDLVKNGVVTHAGTQDLDRATVICSADAVLEPSDYVQSRCYVEMGVGEWRPPLPKCNGPCQTMDIINGTVARAIHGSPAVVTCIEGYVSTPSSTCNDGTFTPAPACVKEEVKAGCPPFTIHNGHKSNDNHQSGSKVSITCNDGYEYTGANPELTCESSGEWSSIPGNCEAKGTVCRMQDFPNGIATYPEGTGIGKTAQIECKEGAEMDPVVLTSVCKNTGEWEPPFPTCSYPSCTTGCKVGIGIGVSAAVIVVLAIIGYFTCRKKKKVPTATLR